MRKSYLIVPTLFVLACTGTQGTMPGETGGSSNAQGGGTNTSNGGQTNTPGNGGATVSGGSTTRGGSDTGTSQPTGGTSSNGGSSTSTTTANNGGASTGGASTSTGGKATGGSTSTGGTSSTNNGGTVAKGGSNPTGGASTSTATGGSSKGGSPSGGASTGNGGATGGSATGGTTSAGGTSSSTSPGGATANVCKNLSFAPSATGKAKPSGAVGGLKVLDWAGFNAAISYTFDDANSSQINNYAAMKAAGGHYTFYLQTAKSEAGNAVYKTALQDGHEMANHTSDHSACTNASAIDAANTFIKNTFGVTAYAFAAPNGAAACNATSVSSKFLTDRSVAGGSMSAGDTNSLTWLPSDIASAGNMAPTAGKWRTICIHGFTGGSDGAYQPIALDSFTSAVKSAVSGGAWVETVTNVAAYQVGQKALSGKTGSATWSLPAVFPPNMCVRVTVTGGTVKQNGTEVPWNDHGYYEISLDAKSITVE